MRGKSRRRRDTLLPAHHFVRMEEWSGTRDSTFFPRPGEGDKSPLLSGETGIFRGTCSRSREVPYFSFPFLFAVVRVFGLSGIRKVMEGKEEWSRLRGG